MTPTHPHLLVTDDGPVRTITLNRADQRNAQVPSLWSALADLSKNTPPEIRVVVLRGAGESFSAGLDRGMLDPNGIPGEPNLLAMAATGTEGQMADAIADFQEGFTAWRSCPAIVIAAVQGYAIGAGFQLALAADLRVVADDVKFAMKEVSLGLVPDLAGTSPLVRMVGYSRALDICATGRFIGAEEAQALGLVTLVATRDNLDKALGRLVHGILSAPARAIAELKPLLVNATEASFPDQIRAEREAQSRRLASLVRGQG